MNRDHCVIESLESRKLFAATVALDSAGVINITGTEANEVVTVALNTKKQRFEVVSDGVYSLFPAASVTGIKAMLGAGNDTFNATHCPMKVYVDGEGGNDAIYGSTGDDNLIGGLDNDFIDGGEGNDSVSGSGGKDNLNGGPGRDRVDGGKSNDIVRGGSSNDRLIGGEGTDEIYGDGGDDLIYCGGIFLDYVYGGTGYDTANVDFADVFFSIENALFS